MYGLFSKIGTESIESMLFWYAFHNSDRKYQNTYRELSLLDTQTFQRSLCLSLFSATQILNM